MFRDFTKALPRSVQNPISSVLGRFWHGQTESRSPATIGVFFGVRPDLAKRTLLDNPETAHNPIYLAHHQYRTAFHFCRNTFGICFAKSIAFEICLATLAEIIRERNEVIKGHFVKQEDAVWEEGDFKILDGTSKTCFVSEYRWNFDRNNPAAGENYYGIGTPLAGGYLVTAVHQPEKDGVQKAGWP